MPLNTGTHLETHVPVHQLILPLGLLELRLSCQINFLGIERMPHDFLNQYENAWLGNLILAQLRSLSTWLPVLFIWTKRLWLFVSYGKKIVAFFRHLKNNQTQFVGKKIKNTNWKMTMNLSESVGFPSGPHSACVNRPWARSTSFQNAPHHLWTFNWVVPRGLH